MKCDTQLVYGTSGHTVSEDGSCRASDTSALQGYVQMCMSSTLRSGDRHTTGIPTKKARDKLGILLTQLMSPLHDDKRATTPYHTSATKKSAIDTSPMFTVSLGVETRDV